jgi:hypothetical protein
MDCMSCLYICVYAKFEILQTTHRVRVVHALRFDSSDRLAYMESAPAVAACARDLLRSRQPSGLADPARAYWATADLHALPGWGMTDLRAPLGLAVLPAPSSGAALAGAREGDPTNLMRKTKTCWKSIGPTFSEKYWLIIDLIEICCPTFFSKMLKIFVQYF